MFRQMSETPREPRCVQALQRKHDARAVTAELAEALSVLVIPALFLSGLNLLLG